MPTTIFRLLIPLLHCQRLKFLILTPRNKKEELEDYHHHHFFLFITRESGKPTFSPSRGQGAIFATFLMHFLGKQRRLATWLWNDQDFLPCPPMWVSLLLFHPNISFHLEASLPRIDRSSVANSLRSREVSKAIVSLMSNTLEFTFRLRRYDNVAQGIRKLLIWKGIRQ